MKILYTILFILLAISISTFASNEKEVKESIKNAALEVESKFSQTKRVKVAILQFRTSDNSLTRFNNFIQDQLLEVYSTSKKFEIINQNSVNRLTESIDWNLEKSQSFRVYTELSEIIFSNLGVVPDAFIYGQVEEKDQSIILTIFYIPNGISRSSISSVQTFVSSEFTDRLLGKSPRSSN